LAGKTLQEIFCWEIDIERLSIYFASTCSGACRIGMSIGKKVSCVDFFSDLYPAHSISKNRCKNRKMIDAVSRLMFNREESNLPEIDIRRTAFQMEVLEAIRSIPFGRTITYGQLALMVGRSGAARAVGQALGSNPLPLFFPCHRVVAAGGSGGFGGGLELKSYLLEREKRLASEVSWSREIII